MRSIERRFLKFQKERPNLSSLINFSGAVSGSNFTADAIGHWFKKLVDPEDYSKEDKRQIVKFMVSLSSVEEGGKEA